MQTSFLTIGLSSRAAAVPVRMARRVNSNRDFVIFDMASPCLRHREQWRYDRLLGSEHVLVHNPPILFLTSN